jgi:hypothetical protein
VVLKVKTKIKTKEDLQMTEEAKAAKREYYRAYRAKNREKVREANRRYWERKAAKRREEAEHEQTATD